MRGKVIDSLLPPFSPPNFQSMFFVMRTSVGKKSIEDLRCKGTLYLKDQVDMVRLGNTGEGKKGRYKEW